LEIIGEVLNEMQVLNRLGGMTNVNLLIDYKQKRYVLRFPSLEFEEIINRKVEKCNNEVAELAGVAIPNIIFTDEGIKLTPYYSSIEKINRDTLKNTSNLKKIGNLFRKLHQIQTPFHNQFDYWTEVERYKSVLCEIPLVYSDYESRILNLTSTETSQFGPCHIDPLPENFIPDSEGNLYLIDWEYSANYLPEWDVAGYALESELTEEERILIEAYADESLIL